MSAAIDTLMLMSAKLDDVGEGRARETGRENRTVEIIAYDADDQAADEPPVEDFMGPTEEPRRAATAFVRIGSVALVLYFGALAALVSLAMCGGR